MVQPPLQEYTTYKFSYGENQDPMEVLLEIKATGGKIDHHDKSLRKFSITIPRNRYDEFEELEARLK